MKLLFITLSALLLTACSTKYCPGFPDYLADYYPYKNGDTLKFVNQNNDTIFYFVSEVSKPNEQTISECYKCDCSFPSFYFYAAGSPPISGVIYTYKSLLSLEFEIFNTNILVASGDPAKDPFNPNDSLLFGKIVVLKNRQGEINISTATIEKGKGIMDFFDSNTNYLWTKIN
ncbi:MAG: hypothetical protein LBT48_08315 [Prevotellaceae bacterium]|jgi:hypothetical protein|nr:hypothetical protein [Prevotellaceae bacterium]